MKGVKWEWNRGEDDHRPGWVGDMEVGIDTLSIKLHPAVLTIRNKRRRMRKVKEWNRRGVFTFISPYCRPIKPSKTK